MCATSKVRKKKIIRHGKGKLGEERTTALRMERIKVKNLKPLTSGGKALETKRKYQMLNKTKKINTVKVDGRDLHNDWWKCCNGYLGITHDEKDSYPNHRGEGGELKLQEDGGRGIIHPPSSNNGGGDVEDNIYWW